MKNKKKIPYDPCQKLFTIFINFHEFINAKQVICKCGKTISLGNNYQVANFKRHSKSKNCNFFVNNQPCIKTQQYFSCENLVGGDITIHIIPQDVVYFLGIQSYSNLNSNLILLDNESFFIYNYFNMPNTQNLLSRIFN